MEQAAAFDGETVAKNLAVFLRRQLGADVVVSGLKRFTVGFSWITFGFEARWRDESGARDEQLIVRLGPPTGLFAPYRAFPQFAALDALCGSAVPVPRAYWYSEELEHFGEYDYLIVNDNFETALKELTSIYIAARCARPRSAHLAIALCAEARVGPATEAPRLK